MNCHFIRRNVVISDRRTSLRLEHEMWLALEEICVREGLDMNALCTELDRRRAGASRSSMVRAFAVGYFRLAVGRAGGLEPRAGLGIGTVFGDAEELPESGTEPVGSTG